MKYAKYVVTFRISCLLTIPSEADGNFNIEENGNSFMIRCFKMGDEVLKLKEAIENQAILLK